MNTVPKCENCGFKRYAEERPNSWRARLWRRHTRWCPGWKAYQRWLAERWQFTNLKPRPMVGVMTLTSGGGLSHCP